MITARFIIGFSGHRGLPEPAAIAQAIREVLLRLRSRAEAVGGSVELYSSIASGADRLAVMQAVDLGIPTHILLPMPEVEFANDFQDTDEWEAVLRHLSAVREGRLPGGVRTLRGSWTRPDCYYEQGLRIMEACDVLVAVWDGQPARGLGGTEQIVRAAEHRGRPVFRIDSVTGEIGEPASLAGEWNAPDRIIDRINDVLRCEAGDAKPISTRDELQNKLDQVANKRAPQFRRGIARVIWTHTLAALIGAVPSLFFLAFVHVPDHPQAAEMEQWKTMAFAFTALEFLLVMLALGFMLVLHWRRAQEKWLLARFAAELVRGLRASAHWLDPMHAQIFRHLPEWRRFALSAGLMAGDLTAKSLPLAERKLAYQRDRLREQIEHFKQKAASARRAHHRWHQVAKWAAILAPVAVGFALVDKFFDSHRTHGWLGAFCGKFLPVALPLIAASATALRNALDYTRRSTRYPDMAARLEAFSTDLASVETEATAATVVARAEEILLDELLEWRLAAENAGAH